VDGRVAQYRVRTSVGAERLRYYMPDDMGLPGAWSGEASSAWQETGFLRIGRGVNSAA